MGKTSKWIRSFLNGKKEKKGSSNQPSFNTENPTTPIAIPPTTPKEKRRWSFRRSAATGAATRDSNSMDSIITSQPRVQIMLESENEQKKQAMAVAAAQASAAVIRLTTAATGRPSAVEEAAAIKIQAVFRSYLARKALCALKGLVKLQALVRGHLVRKQATAALRCMEALVTAQARARAQRIRMTEEAQPITRRQLIHKKSLRDNQFRQANNELDRGMEENIKIVEMDLGESRGSLKSRNSYSNHPQIEQAEHRFSQHYARHHARSKQDHQPQISPAPSSLTDMSPRTCSGHFEEYSFTTTQSNPQYYSAMSRPDPPRAFARTEHADSMSHDYAFFPNYMAKTESYRAKVRSQSAPKQRPDLCERQPSSRRKASMEGRNVPRGVRMQRSSSHVGSTAHGYQYPCSTKLDRSMVSLKDSECGSTSTVLTNTSYYRSLVAYEPRGTRMLKKLNCKHYRSKRIS
ncbi:hypothetical protein HHK36_020578 [Tetracentron sinense]|uniref:DUF4005 domain-containing protein n=1 Tax=Tetracentron sinense TaxID=13715 RepID=A0A834YU92_TETSI|nr:hypothetical protein HHK36_020578 [Tetracentron sinense]